MTIATDYVNHLYSLYKGRAAVTVGVNGEQKSVHPFVYENVGRIPVGLVAMSANHNNVPTEVDLYHLSTFLPGKGEGSAMLGFLCDAADVYGVRLNLQADVQCGGADAISQNRLVGWYRKFGFEGVNADMHRDPSDAVRQHPAT